MIKITEVKEDVKPSPILDFLTFETDISNKELIKEIANLLVQGKTVRVKMNGRWMEIKND